ncbi:MAG: hypothetical protein K0R26_1730 [Bacteroidota bacterium]|jgi:hypothetical protein|nr:hypothetical protein [Bacteroidota bacterium]
MIYKSLLFLFTFCIYKAAKSQVWHEKAQLFQIGVGDNYVIKTRIEENRLIYTSKNTASFGKISIRTTPAFFIKFERALTRNIGIGMSVGYRKTEITQVIPYIYYDTTTTYPTYIGGVGVVYHHPQRTGYDIFNFKINDLAIGAKLNYHLLPGKIVDPYIGIAAGYRLFDRSYSYTADNNRRIYYVVEYENVLPVYFSGTLGVRYFITDDLGVYAEVGIDKWSIIQGGFVFKIK